MGLPGSQRPAAQPGCGRSAARPPAAAVSTRRQQAIKRPGPAPAPQLAPVATRDVSAAVAQRPTLQASTRPASPPRAVADAEAPVATSDAAALEAKLDSHPGLVQGRLENGFEYVILPNRSPPNQFEAHLQMHVGSVDEGAHEQGIAHFVEHITFLGSRKRDALSAMGGRSNAYTDFQHTIFHVTCPTTEGNAAAGRPLLEATVEMLSEVAFGAEFLRTRIEKERKAVLAEAQMMNTIEYRMDCQLLQYLHEENALGHRFPIGMVDQVKKWTKEELHAFWRKWYFPANGTLYLVGDFDAAGGVPRAIEHIRAHFGRVAPKLGADDALVTRAPVRPPVDHHWGMGPLREGETLPCKVSMFRHPLVSNYILNVFAKLPIHPMGTIRNVLEIMCYRIAVSVFQRRVAARYIEGDAQFHMIEYEIADSAREGTCVVSMTITAEPKDWQSATRAAVQEAQRIVQHGILRTEVEEYSKALLADGEQLAMSMDTQPHIEMMNLAIETISNKQVLNSNVQAQEAMVEAARHVTPEAVNAIARSMFAFVASYGAEEEALAAAAADPAAYAPPGPTRPSSITACVPAFVQESGDAIDGGLSARPAAEMTTGGHLDGSGIDVDAVMQPGAKDPEEEAPPPPGSIRFDVDEAAIQRVLSEKHDMAPLPEVTVPERFISEDELATLLATHEPEFVPVAGREDEGPLPPAEAASGVVQRRLSNGVTLNYKQTTNEPGSATARVCGSGGRAAEPRSGHGVGAMQVGMRTLSESGTVGDCVREEIEMFCLTHLITCIMETDVENLFIDWRFSSDEAGLRGVFELIHLMVERPAWNDKAFERACTSVVSASRAVQKSMERANYDRASEAVYGADRRFREPSAEEVGALSLGDVKATVEKWLRPDNLEITIVGDFEAEALERHFRDYLGTIAPRAEPLALPHAPIEFTRDMPLPQRHQVWHLDDSEERGIGNIAGLAFRRWGAIDGDGPVQPLASRIRPPPSDPRNGSETERALAQTVRRAHPLFAPMALRFLQELVSARLYLAVRDRLNLTYDVSFEISQHDRLNASWWCVNVTAAPPKIQAATQACIQVLRDIKGPDPLSWSEVDRMRKTLLQRDDADLKDNNHILNLLTHLQAADVPLKTIDLLRDMPAMISTMTAADLNDAFALFGLDDDEIFSVIATAGPEAPDPPPKLQMQGEGGVAAAKGRGSSVSDTLLATMAAAMARSFQEHGERKSS